MVTMNTMADEFKCLKNCFDLFDSKEQDFPSTDELDKILREVCFEIPAMSGF